MDLPGDDQRVNCEHLQPRDYSRRTQTGYADGLVLRQV